MLVNDMIAAVYVERFTSNQPCSIAGEERRRRAYILNTDKLTGRSFGLSLVKQCIKFGNSRGCPGGQRPRWQGLLRSFPKTDGAVKCPAFEFGHMTDDIVEFAMGAQSRIGSNDRSKKLQRQYAVEIKPGNAVV
jgi:hypothetical protein